jgi:tetratricopeptide (TPR) repeat protein
MPHDLLERLFVARERTLDRIMARVDAAATSEERNHTLLVGPRGSGKTHLVSLVYHRSRNSVPVAWLPEDPWTIVSYHRFLRAIAERVTPEFEGPLPPDEPALEALLVKYADSKGPILVIVENVDHVLGALGNPGQQRLRHLLQARRAILLVATTTRLDRSLSDQASPFYGFFTTTQLEPFDAAEAAAMLSAIAAEDGNDELVTYLASDEGTRRLQTVAHLAGGQPRIWALLASALEVARLTELVYLLLERFDDLTPYYQEQLARLSPQQRLIVAELAGADRPINLADLAQRLGITQRSLSKTTTELVERGWVEPTASPLASMLDRRRTYYELAEPLARIAFQIKESRGEPLKLIVDFLEHWFDPDDFDGPLEVKAAEYVKLAAAAQHTDPVLAVTRRLNRLSATRASAVEFLSEVDRALESLEAGNPEPLLELPTSVRTAIESRLVDESPRVLRHVVHRAAWEDYGRVPHPSMDSWIARSEQAITSAHGTPADYSLLIGWLARAWRFAEAEQAQISAEHALGSNDELAISSRTDLASALVAAGRFADGIDLYERSIEDLKHMFGAAHPTVLRLTNDLATAYESAGSYAEARSRYVTALAGFERTYGIDHASTLTVRNNLAMLHAATGQPDEGLRLQEQVVPAIERLLGPTHPNTLVAKSNLGSAYQSVGRHEDAIRVLEGTLETHVQVLGAHALGSLLAAGNLAMAYSDAGRWTDATSMLERVLEAHELILGADHPTTLTTRSNLGSAYLDAGRITDAVAQYENALEVRERVLGSDHPLTQVTRENLRHALSAGRPSPPTDPAPALDPR